MNMNLIYIFSRTFEYFCGICVHWCSIYDL